MKVRTTHVSRRRHQTSGLDFDDIPSVNHPGVTDRPLLDLMLTIRQQRQRAPEWLDANPINLDSLRVVGRLRPSDTEERPCMNIISAKDLDWRA